MAKLQKFPNGFLWGASTAAHQVEGNTHNQWSEWELANAGRLAATFTKRLHWLPNLDEVTPAGTDPANYVSGRGVEHYERYREDFGILQELGMNAFRFSIEWSRIEPEEGKWNEQAIAHYREYISELKRRNIEPVLTLWHWTMPVWFTAKGGFAKRSNVMYFVRFAHKIGELFGDELRYVVTLNEPNVYTQLSYLQGEWPPQGKNPLTAIRVYGNLVHAHRRAYSALKQGHPNIQVGIAMQAGNVLPKRPRDGLARCAGAVAEYLNNWWFLDRIRRQQDFIGINYYFTHYLGGLRPQNPKTPVSDLGWYMAPGLLDRLLRRVSQRYRLPVIITENGLADAHDAERQWWLEETLAALQRALDAGVDLRGYLHWSLLDNFEWAYGWWPKFGLVSVDRKTMKRTIRPSARWFADYIKKL